MAVRIMLDPGHAGLYYNQSPVVPGYYESAMTWSLAAKLKSALERYGFQVGLTRQTVNEDPELTERGRRAKGYDLFLSLHSNAAASEAPDAPWMIHFLPDSKTAVDEKSKAVAQVLGSVVSNTMGVSAPYYYTKDCGSYDRDGNGYYDDEYYGVLFGAKSVGVPGVIIEHSFHTNKAAAKWLMNESNLQTLAENEARAIANYFGIKEEDLPMTTAERKEFEALKASVKSLTSQIKNLEKENSDLRKQIEKMDKSYDHVEIKYNWTTACPTWARDTVHKLQKKGFLKGDEKGQLKLSEDMCRMLVVLDRAGVFGE